MPEATTSDARRLSCRVCGGVIQPGLVFHAVDGDYHPGCLVGSGDAGKSWAALKLSVEAWTELDRLCHLFGLDAEEMVATAIMAYRHTPGYLR